MNTPIKTSWLTLGVIGLLCISVMAEPPPEREKISATDLAKQSASLEGKVIRVSFNRIAYLMKTTNELFSGELRSQVAGKGAEHIIKQGLLVMFPLEGYGFMSRFIPDDIGSGTTPFTVRSAPDDEEIYVLIGHPVSTVLGDRYQDGVYEWSKKTVLPDLNNVKNVSISELFLFPEQVNGKALRLEFYYALEQDRRTQPHIINAYSSRMDGYIPLPIEVPPEGAEFFQKAVYQGDTSLKAHTVFVKVEASPGGNVSAKALGLRKVGKGDEATYKW